MKKALFYLPGIIFFIFGLLMADAAGPEALLVTALYLIPFVISGLLLSKGRAWGCFIGCLPGGHLVYSGLHNWKSGSFEMLSGAVLVTYYLICGLTVLLLTFNKAALKSRLLQAGVFSAAALAVAVFVAECFFINDNNRMLTSAMLSLDDKVVALNDVVPFDWDAVYRFGPYSTKRQIHAAIGVRSFAIRDTGERETQAIFVKGHRVVAAYIGMGPQEWQLMNLPVIEKAGADNYSGVTFSQNTEFSVTRQFGVVILAYIAR